MIYTPTRPNIRRFDGARYGREHHKRRGYRRAAARSRPVAIDVAYAGVNFIDVMARGGDPGYASSWPYVPGPGVAGIIRSGGSGVHDQYAASTSRRSRQVARQDRGRAGCRMGTTCSRGRLASPRLLDGAHTRVFGWLGRQGVRDHRPAPPAVDGRQVGADALGAAVMMATFWWFPLMSRSPPGRSGAG